MLFKVGIGGSLLTWFSNFLNVRFFNVKVGNVRSKYITVNSGVSRGTMLVPLLFILFINNVCDGLNNSQIQLYTDDIPALYCCLKSWQLKVKIEK